MAVDRIERDEGDLFVRPMKPGFRSRFAWAHALEYARERRPVGDPFIRSIESARPEEYDSVGTRGSFRLKPFARDGAYRPSVLVPVLTALKSKAGAVALKKNPARHTQ